MGEAGAEGGAKYGHAFYLQLAKHYQSCDYTVWISYFHFSISSAQIVFVGLLRKNEETFLSGNIPPL